MKKEIIEALKNPDVAKAIGDGISNAVIKALKDAGVECTADDVKELFKVPEGKLSDENLENVAGGFNLFDSRFKNIPFPTTQILDENMRFDSDTFFKNWNPQSQ